MLRWMRVSFLDALHLVKHIKVFNKYTLVVKEFIYIIFDEANDLYSRKEDMYEDDAEILENGMKELNLKERSTQDEDEGTKDTEQEKNTEQEVLQRYSDLPKEWRYAHNHPRDLIIDDPSQGVRTRSSFRDTFNYLVFVPQIKSKYIEEAENDSNWILTMQEELNQFEKIISGY